MSKRIVALVLMLAVVSLVGMDVSKGVAGTMQRPQTCSIVFNDLTGNIFASYIYDLACMGVVNGTGGGNFSPGQPATRAQFAKMTALGFAIANYTPSNASFTDVSPTYWAYSFIEALRQAGISSGYTQQAQCQQYGATAPCYLPNRSISRAEVTVLVIRAAGYTLTTPANPSFYDVPTSFFAYAQIETARNLGIVSGLNGYFRPSDPIRRDELCRILDLGIQYRSGTPTPLPLTSQSIYADALDNGWQDWSWGSTRNFANTNPVHGGNKSLALTYTEGYGGLLLHHSNFALAPYTYLRFYIHGGTSGNQTVQVRLIDSNGQFRGVVGVGDYVQPEHSIVAGQWREISIPLADIAPLTSISGIAWQSGSDAVQPGFYIDDISLTNAAPPRPSPTPPGPSPTSIPSNLSYYRGVNLSGAEYMGTYGVDYIYPNAAEFDYYKRKGLNFVRLPFRWERLQPTLNGNLDATELTRLDTMLSYAQARGMYLLLEPHNYDRYNLNGTDYLVGSPQVPDSAFADFWRKLAQHFVGQPYLFYGLMNEPYDTGNHWYISAQAAVTAIRQVDMGHTIFVPGDCWQGAWSWADCNPNLNINDPANNFIYDAHQYFDADSSGRYAQSYDQQGAYPNIGVDRLQPFITWLGTQGGRRGFLSEYGAPRNDVRWLAVIDNLLTNLDQHNIGASWWSGGPWVADYQLSIEPFPDGSDRPQMSILQRHLGRQQ